MFQSEDTHQIFMSFWPVVVGHLLKKAHKRGGHEHPRTSLATPLTCMWNIGLQSINLPD